MRKLTPEELKQLEKNNTGELENIKVPEGFDLSNSEIINNAFYGKNEFNGKVKLVNSIIQETRITNNCIIERSKITDSIIGPGTYIENSALARTITSPLVIQKKAFVVIIKNSEFNNDVILGGSDFNKTKSRGGSVFGFCHIGEGEFTKNVVLGTPPIESKNTLALIPHYGYYGKMIVLSLAVYKKGNVMHDINSREFFEDYRKAFSKIYFGTNEKVIYKIGRTNIGAGGCVSDYDPITDKKSGVIMLLANSGIQVSFSPYLTVLYNSLIANGSVDISKLCRDGVIPPNSLVIGSRDNSALLEGYYAEDKKGVLNDRCAYEVDFVLRYMNFLKMIAEVASQGLRENISDYEKFAWSKAAENCFSCMGSVKKRWLEYYFKVLEQRSIPVLKKRIAEDNRKKLKNQLAVQLHLLKDKEKILSQAQKIYDEAEKLISEKDFQIYGKKYEVAYTSEQKNQISNPLSIVEV